MYKIQTVEETQDLLLPIMVYIDRICRKYNLRYSLAYGTLLGAVRHQSFIPWDDDIDIMMPRPDYNRLIDILKKEIDPQYAIMNPYDLSSFYAIHICKIYRKDTLLKEYPHKFQLEYGAYVDIFAVDGMPDSLEDAINIEKDVHYASKKVYMYTSSQYRKNILRRMIGPLLKGIGIYGFNKCNHIFESYPFDEAQFVGNLLGEGLQKERMCRQDFDQYIDIEFKGHQFKAIKNYDQYLTQIFGDYMTLPPEEERVSLHQNELYKL